MLFEKLPYEKPQVIVEFDLVVSAGIWTIIRQ